MSPVQYSMLSQFVNRSGTIFPDFRRFRALSLSFPGKMVYTGFINSKR